MNRHGRPTVTWRGITIGFGWNSGERDADQISFSFYGVVQDPDSRRLDGCSRQWSLNVSGGKVIRKSGDTLTLLTDYAGEIKLQWSKIVSIVTDVPSILQLEGTDDPVKAKLGEVDPEHVSLARRDDTGTGEAGPEVVRLNRILYINPLPEETVNGVSHKGRANLSVAKTDGNSSSERLYGETGFAGRAKSYRYDLNAKFNRGKESGTLVSSNWLVGGNYDRFLDRKRFVYGRTSVEKDIFKDIDRRSVIGAGYGLQLLDTQQAQLSVRGGLDYVRVDHVDASRESYPSLGWGVKYSQRLEGYHAEIFHEQEGFWNITDIGQITLRTRSGLRIPLMAGITANSQLNVDWERRPTSGRRPTDSMFLFGLGYEW